MPVNKFLNSYKLIHTGKISPESCYDRMKDIKLRLRPDFNYGGVEQRVFDFCATTCMLVVRDEVARIDLRDYERSEALGWRARSLSRGGMTAWVEQEIEIAFFVSSVVAPARAACHVRYAGEQIPCNSKRAAAPEFQWTGGAINRGQNFIHDRYTSRLVSNLTNERTNEREEVSR